MVLFELIIALFIFTLVVFSLVMALDAGMGAARTRNNIATAIMGMNDQLVLLHGSRLTPSDQDLPDDGTGITYHLTVEPKQLKDQKGFPVPNIYEATVTAKWIADGQKEDRSLSELIYQP
jgi:hypothetical protein